MLKKELKRKEWGLDAVQSEQRTVVNHYLGEDSSEEDVDEDLDEDSDE